MQRRQPGVTITRDVQEGCRSLERHVLRVLAPRTGVLPVRGAAGCRRHVQGYAPRPRPRWTAERFSVVSNWEMAMAKADGPWTQLATRIPKELHRRLKLHCVTHEVSVMDFVVGAIEEKLGRKTRPKKGTA